GLSGYFTVASSLKDVFEAHGPLGADELCAVTHDDCARMFGQTLDDPPVAELMGLFAQALNDLGQYVAQKFDGRFERLVASAHGSVERLAVILADMPF